PTMTIGQQAVMSNLDETLGQNMLHKATQELAGIERHCLVPVAVGVVPVAKRHPAIAQLDEAGVAYVDAVGVAGQGPKHLRGAAERPLAVDHPVAGVQRLPPGGADAGLSEPVQSAGQEQLSLVEGGVQASEELAAEDTAQHPHRQKEAGPTRPP